MILDAADAGGTELASIVENRMLQHALWQLLLAPNISVVCHGRLTSIEWAEESVSLRHEDGRELGCRLLIGADGAQSRVRGQAGIQAAHAAYGQKGVVANFACERPHRGWHASGSLTMASGVVTVAVNGCLWSGRCLTTRPILCWRWTGAHCVNGLRLRVIGELGALTQLTPAAAFPLRLLRLSRTIGDRLALIGDAAHNASACRTGVSTGFQDVRLLASLLNRPGAPADLTAQCVANIRTRPQGGCAADATGDRWTAEIVQQSSPSSLPVLRNIGLDDWQDGASPPIADPARLGMISHYFKRLNLMTAMIRKFRYRYQPAADAGRLPVWFRMQQQTAKTATREIRQKLQAEFPRVKIDRKRDADCWVV